MTKKHQTLQEALKENPGLKDELAQIKKKISPFIVSKKQEKESKKIKKKIVKKEIQRERVSIYSLK